MKVVKHPPYCLFTRETRILAYRVGPHNWRLMSQKERRTRHFANACLPRLAQKSLLCRLNLYVEGSITVDWLLKPHQETKALNPTWISHEKHCTAMFLFPSFGEIRNFGKLKISWLAFFCFVLWVPLRFILNRSGTRPFQVNSWSGKVDKTLINLLGSYLM